MFTFPTLIAAAIEQKKKYLLDIYPGASFGYSVRKLRAAYTGYSMKVRRDSDNAEQDIGFVDGMLDVDSLLSFVGNGNGFLRTFYDQSGNGNNANQTNAAYQPKIVNSGSVYTINSIPAILQNISSYDYNFALILTNTVDAGKDHSMYVVGQRLAKNRHFYLINGSYPAYMEYSNGSFYSQMPSLPSGNIRFNSFPSTNISHTLYEVYNLSLVQKIHFNNVEKTLTMGGSAGVNNTFTEVCYSSYGYYQELIFYQSDKTSDRSGIISNINNYYSIY